MDKKLSCLTADTIRKQRVEIYLQDLKDRLKELHQKHAQVIESSEDIIKEIDHVSSTLLTSANSRNDISVAERNSTNIKKLIQEFELAKVKNPVKSIPVDMRGTVNIQEILRNFEQLNQSCVLQESLLLFRKAKESFDKIGNYIDKLEDNTNVTLANIKKKIFENTNKNKQNSNKYIREINSFSKNSLDSNEHFTDNDFEKIKNSNCDDISMIVINEKMPDNSINKTKETYSDQTQRYHQPSKNQSISNEDSTSYYASCSSSVTSITKYHSSQELTKRQSMDFGYEGDYDDSECN